MMRIGHRTLQDLISRPSPQLKPWRLDKLLHILAMQASAIYQHFSESWRRKWMITAVCAAAIALAWGIILRTEPIYLASAIVEVDALDEAANSQSEPVGSAAALIRSEPMARRVAERLGLDAMPTDPNSNMQRLNTNIVGPLSRKAGAPPSRIDVSARQLMRNLKVKIEPRSSLITVTYASPSPEEAARIANAVVGELLRNQNIKKLTDRRALAERALLELSNTFGDQHPRIARAEANLALARAQLLAEEQKGASVTEKELAETGKVVPAQAVTIPSGLGTVYLMILVLVAGGIAGIGFALLSDTAFRRALLSRLFGASRGKIKGTLELADDSLPEALFSSSPALR